MEKETLEALIKSDDMGLLALRKEYARFFVTKTRADGKRFITLMDNEPQDLCDVIYSIHKAIGCGFPNDWIYSVIRDAFEDLFQDDLDDIQLDADIYNVDLCEWLKETYANDACHECMIQEMCTKNDIMSIISCAQICVKQQIYEAVNDFINEEE